MKTKKSKRLLAAFLAAIMVLTTFAAMPFSSYAAEHSAEDLKTLIEQYETRIESSTRYTNLANSYEAWYDAYLTYFLVTAGTESAEAVDEAYTNLQTQMNAMQAWTPAQATASQAADGSYTKSGLTGGDVMSNVLYAYGVGENAPHNNVETGAWYNTITRTGVQYGDAVLMYDGINEVGFPISHYQARIRTTGDSRTRSLNPTSSDFELRHDWHGYGTSAGYQSNTQYTFSYIENTGGGSESTGSEGDPYRYSNTLYWAGDSSTFGSNYFLQYSGQEWRAWDNRDNSGTFTNNANIYVINYAAVIDAVNNLPSNICQYPYSQAIAYMRAIDTATSINPQSYFTGGDIATEVQSCSGAISSAIFSVNSARRALGTTIDMSSYIELARNYAAYTPIASGNNENGYYTPGSYTPFKNNYDSVTTMINALAAKTQRFGNTAASTNTQLVAAYNDLVPAEQYIDDSELQSYFQQYYNLTQSYYTAETYSAVTEKINAALVYYNDSSYTSGIILKDNDEDRATYNTILTDVKNAMAGLRISHDATLAIGGVPMSYNMAVEYSQSLDSGRYANYSEVMDSVAAATALMTALDQHQFTTQDEIIAEYREVLTNIAVAFGSLELAFTAIEDGTVVSQTIGSTNGYSADNVRSYLSDAITNITYFKTTSGTSSYTTEYDLTFDNQWYEWTAYRGAQYHALGFGAYGQDTISNSNGTMSVRWKEGGAPLENADGGAYNYHTALMKTPDTQTETQYRVHVFGGQNGQKILGETTVTVGDLGIRSVSFTTPDIYEFFFVETNETLGTTLTRSRTNTDVKQTVTIIDMSDLIELVNQASSVMASYQNNAFNCITPDLWSAFTNALTAAQANMSYTEMSNDQIVAELQTRYNNLETAMGDLQENTAEGSHNLIEQADSTHATCTTAGDTHYICSVCGHEIRNHEDALGHKYVYTANNNGTDHTVTCERCDDYSEIVACTDGDGNLYCDVCGQALYTPADFREFNAARAELETLLAASANGSMKFKSAALSATNDAIAGIGYYNTTEQEQLLVADTMQGDIDNQTQMISTAVEALRNDETDESVYEANQYKVSTLNADAYDVTAVQSAVQGINVETPVEVNGKDYTGYDYDNYNYALGTALNENRYEYYICVYDVNYNTYWLVNNGDGTYEYTEANGDTPESGFHYGDTITLENPSSADEICRWATVAYTDNSADDVSYGTPKYQTTASSYTFNVRGNMDIYTTAAASADDALNEIRFILAYDGVSTGQVLDIQYASNGMVMINSLMPDIQHNIPFHSFSQYLYEDGTAVPQNNRLTVNGDMNVLVNYETLTPDSYTVNLYSETDDATPVYSTYPTYNEKVTLSNPGAVAYVNADNGKVLCYGSEYTFYAYESMNVKAVTSIDEQKAYVDVIKAPIVDETGKVYIFGTFALPKGTTIKSYGIVMNAGDANDTDLSLADLNKNRYIFNLSSSSYTCEGQNGNQFGISFTSSSGFPRASYVAYAIYEGADGNEYYVYSDVITQASIY